MSIPDENLGEGMVAAERPLDVTRLPSRGKVVFGRLLRSPEAAVGLIALVLLVLLAVLGPFFGNWDYTQKDFEAFLQAPSADHWFGTTQVGQDVYAITVQGMQKSLLIGFMVAIVSTGLSAVVGTFAGYYGGLVNRALMWVVDLLMVLPAFLIIAIISPSLRGSSWLWFVPLIALFLWMVTARIVRGLTIALREREYVLAARYIGLSGPAIIFRHIVPNLSSLLIVDATLNVSAAIMTETGLSYFGFGVRPPDVSLGTLIADGAESVTTYPWLFLYPAGVLVLIILSVNLIGDGLRDALDPTSRRG